MYMLAEYASIGMANNLAFDKVNMPDFSLLAAGMIISLIGMVVGHIMYRRRIE